jgi:hypothetical protein
MSQVFAGPALSYDAPGIDWRLKEAAEQSYIPTGVADYLPHALK